jgi:P27 family predicted phage terminase small subunit
MGVLAEIDAAALAAYCEAYASWVDAVEKLRQFGKIVKAPKSGHPMPNPYVSIANQALDHMRKFGTEFGMTPSSRSRITAGEEVDRDDRAAKYFERPTSRTQ